MEVVREIGYKAGGYESLVVDNTAGGVGFTAAEIRPTSGDFLGKAAQRVEITVENQSVRFTKDGTVPISGVASAITHGHLVAAGGTITLKHPKDISNFLAISIDGTDAWLRSTFMFEN